MLSKTRGLVKINKKSSTNNFLPKKNSHLHNYLFFFFFAFILLLVNAAYGQVKIKEKVEIKPTITSDGNNLSGKTKSDSLLNFKNSISKKAISLNSTDIILTTDALVRVSISSADVASSISLYMRSPVDVLIKSSAQVWEWRAQTRTEQARWVRNIITLQEGERLYSESVEIDLQNYESNY